MGRSDKARKTLLGLMVGKQLKAADKPSQRPHPEPCAYHPCKCWDAFHD